MNRLRHISQLIPDTRQVAANPPQPVETFAELVREVAWLSNSVPSQLLFYRGQRHDHLNAEGSTTLYPEIYRGETLRREEVLARFEVLESAAGQLVRRLAPTMGRNAVELRKRKYIQWSILQHYDVCATPLLDVTQSLRVACSFALLGNGQPYGCVYVLALPYLTNRISVNSEEDTVNVRLLSICPPEALRPHFQEGYVVGTLDTTTEYEKKSELDFNRRLVRKFAIPNREDFWGPDSRAIPQDLLFPNDADTVLQATLDTRAFSDGMARAGDVGEFVRLWARMESHFRYQQEVVRSRYESLGRTIQDLLKSGRIKRDAATRLENLRTLRNKIVHRTDEVPPAQLSAALEDLRSIMRDLDIKT